MLKIWSCPFFVGGGTSRKILLLLSSNILKMNSMSSMQFEVKMNVVEYESQMY